MMEPTGTSHRTLQARIAALESQVASLEVKVRDYQRVTADLKKMHEIGVTLMALTTVDDILTYVLMRAAEFARTEHGFAQVLAEDGLQMHAAADLGVFANAPMLPPTSDEGFVGQIIATGQMLIVTDYDNWPHRREGWPKGLTGTLLGLPLKANDSTIGVLLLAHREAERSFRPEVIQTIEALVELAAPALEKARLHAELDESRYFIERITDTVPSIIYVFDMRSGQSVYVNSAVQHLLGYDEDDIIMRDPNFLQQLIHPDDMPLIIGHTMKLHEADENTSLTVEYRMRHASGEWRWFRSRDRIFRMGEDGQPLQSVGVVQDIHDQKSAELALRYQAGLLDTLADAVIAADKDFRIRSWNGGAERLYGWTEEEVIGQPVQDILKSEATNPAMNTEEAGEILGETGRYAGEFITYRKDGTPVPIWTVTSLVHDEQGELVGSVAVNRDVTEMRRTARELERNRHFLQSITDTAQMLIYAHSLTEGRNLFLNQYAREFFGEALSHLVETDALAFFERVLHRDHYDEFARSALAWQQVADGEPVKRMVRMRNAIGDWRWLDMTEVVLRRDDAGNVMEIMGTAIDVTESKEVGDSLRKSEERFRTLFEYAPVGIVLVQMGGQIIASNPAMQEFLGYTTGELMQLTLADYTVPEDVDREVVYIKQLRAGEIDHYRLEKRYIHKDGRVLWGRISASLFQIAGERMGVAMVEDITEQKAHEAHNRQIDIERARVRMLAEFIRDVSHDFRTPLSTMYTSMYMLRRIWDNEERRDHHMNVLQSQIGHLEKLVEGLFTMARLDATEALVLAGLDINEMLREIASKIQNRKENGFANIRLALAAEHPLILANGPELHTALLNLVENAIMFSQADQEIVLETVIATDMVEINVIDSGNGIEPEDLPHIFERFYRADKARSQSGLGLGLPIAQKIVEKHSGTITVNSTPGAGTVVCVRLPRA